MLNPNRKQFIDRLKKLPHFDYAAELAVLVERHGDSAILLQAIIDDKLVIKDDGCRYWADSMHVAYVDPFASVITEEAIDKIPMEVAKKVKAIGLYVLNGVLTTAMASPADTELIRRLSQIAQVPISPVFALPREIEDAIAVNYCTEKGLEESLTELERSSLFDKPEIAGEKLAVLAENNALIQILDEIVYFAIRERATDIHIEAQETQSRIRFRIDGNLREILTYSRKLHRALISRIKILCNLNISESRFPQDGRFSMPVGSQTANFRVSTIPSAYGEKTVIRVLAMIGKKSMLTLEKMMISQTILQPFKRLIQNPNGIIFVTGPTGSGKTTTLYAALHEINSPTVNVSTIEDPIEIPLAGVNQSQVNANIDLKFATILRALMRQDPDVILIGEIRDLETALIATEAALTGHLVLTTLHTNNALQAVTRLVEIGVDPYLVAPTTMGVLSQRLVRRLCSSCKEQYQATEQELAPFFSGYEGVPVTLCRGRGCPKCFGTGYSGRVGIYEFVEVSEKMRELITEKQSVALLIEEAKRVGHHSLRYDGLKKALMGWTSLEEVERSTLADVGFHPVDS